MIPFAVVCVITMLVVWKVVSRPLETPRNSSDRWTGAGWSSDSGTSIGGLEHHSPWSDSHSGCHDYSGGDGHDCGSSDGGFSDGGGDCSGGD